MKKFWEEHNNFIGLLNLLISFILIIVCISLNYLNEKNYSQLKKQEYLIKELIKTDSVILTKYLDNENRN